MYKDIHEFTALHNINHLLVSECNSADINYCNTCHTESIIMSLPHCITCYNAHWVNHYHIRMSLSPHYCSMAHLVLMAIVAIVAIVVYDTNNVNINVAACKAILQISNISEEAIL